MGIEEMFPDACDEAVDAWDSAVMLTEIAAGAVEFSWLDDMARGEAKRFCRMVRANWNGPVGEQLRELLVQASEVAEAAAANVR